jgi:hypothetical protein
VAPLVSAAERRSSPARVAANRANSQRSTGPRSAAGKRASSQNATRHGVLSRQPLLPGEDPAELEVLTRRLLEQLRPVGSVEELLVDDILGLVWRLRRVARVEVALYSIGLRGPVLKALSAAGEASSALGLAFSEQAASFAVLTRYETALVHRLRRALADLERLQAARLLPNPILVAIPGGA